MARQVPRSLKQGRERRADGARVTHAAHRSDVPWYRRTRTLYAGLAGGLFVFGILLGTTIGLMLAPGEPPPRATVAMPEQDGPRTGLDLPEGSPLPVTARDSDQARQRYEEALAAQPAEVRPDPNVAPPPPVPPPAAAALTAPDSEALPVSPSARPEAPPTAATTPGPPLRIANAVPFERDSGRPMIAFVFDDLGIDQPRSRRALDLPAPMTMAFLPYGFHLTELVDAARRNGHEILVHVPMAPMGLGIDPGPNALHPELERAELLRRLDWNLSRFGGYVGINNHMGSRFTADAASMGTVIAELKRRGLVFMDSITTTQTKGYGLAARMGVPYAVRDVFLDHEITPEAIRGQLRRVEETARKQGWAVAIGHPHDETLATVRAWLSRPEARAFQLVPISAVIRARAEGRGS